RRVGGYEILAELGKGGMGVVYLARQTGCERLVALKMIRTGHAGQEGARFQAEAEAARLHHPNIVAVFETGSHAADGAVRPYLVLEYVAGGSLDRRLAGSPLPACVA